MSTFTQVTILGNLTRDVEVRSVSGGNTVADLGVAVNERVRKGEDWVDEAHYFDVTLWNKTAEIAAQFLSKGSPVCVTGRLKYETWTKDDVKRSKVSIIGDRLHLVGGKRDDSQPSTKPTTAPADDDVEF